jgi:thiol-disulfide isomerase/thioredoxin
MSVFRVSYEDFIQKAQQSPGAPFEPFVQEEKTVYVYALTRDLCSGCKTQKPLYEALSNSINDKHGERVKFNAIHVAQQEQFRKPLQDFRELVTSSHG